MTFGQGYQDSTDLIDAALDVGHQYRHLSLTQRLALRWVAPDLARASARAANGGRRDQHRRMPRLSDYGRSLR